jgi:hypothetical protein
MNGEYWSRKARETGKPYYQKDDDGTFTRFDPDGSKRAVSGWDPGRMRGIGCLILGLIVFVLGIVVIVIVASHVSHPGSLDR